MTGKVLLAIFVSLPVRFFGFAGGILAGSEKLTRLELEFLGRDALRSAGYLGRRQAAVIVPSCLLLSP